MFAIGRCIIYLIKLFQDVYIRVSLMNTQALHESQLIELNKYAICAPTGNMLHVVHTRTHTYNQLFARSALSAIVFPPVVFESAWERFPSRCAIIIAHEHNRIRTTHWTVERSRSPRQAPLRNVSGRHCAPKLIIYKTRKFIAIKCLSTTFKYAQWLLSLGSWSVCCGGRVEEEEVKDRTN